VNLEIETPEWAEPLLAPSRFKGARGGRASGKSHFFAERLVEHHIVDAELSSVCVRETQKSLKFSAKRLVEDKIRALGVPHLFEIRHDMIRRAGGNGVIIFIGMADATADSAKSLEGFGIAWCEEAQRLSQRSLELLVPTIRTEGSELWFSWNPDQDTDPVDRFLLDDSMGDDAINVQVNYTANPWCPDVISEEADRHLRRDPDTYPHVWLGEYNTKSDDQVLAGRWAVDEFTPGDDWDGPYIGADWGFSSDPTTLVKAYVHGGKLYLFEELHKVGVEVVDTPRFFDRMEGSRHFTIRADNARPEIISHMRSHGFPKIRAANKWPGSVEDGISALRGYDKIIIHPQCPRAIDEARLWRYKRDKLTGDVLPKLIPGNDHIFDGLRYAIEPMTKRARAFAAW
jgi:phage terminase large subunit